MALAFLMPILARTPILGASARAPHFDEFWRGGSRRLRVGGSSAFHGRGLDGLGWSLRLRDRRWFGRRGLGGYLGCGDCCLLKILRRRLHGLVGLR